MYITERLTVNNVTGETVTEEAGAATGVGDDTTFRTDLVTAADDYYNDMTLRFTSGANLSETRTIDNFTQLNGEFTVTEPFTAAPGPADTFIIERTPTTTVFWTDLGAADAFYDNMEIEFTSGACKGQQATIQDYVQLNGMITLVPADALSRIPADEDTFIIWTELTLAAGGAGSIATFDLPVKSRWCKITYIKIVQLAAGPMEIDFEIWESTAARDGPIVRPNLYQQILTRRYSLDVLLGAQVGESLSGDPMPYYDRDAQDEEKTFCLHCRLENFNGGTASDFAVSIKIADMGERV